MMKQKAALLVVMLSIAAETTQAMVCSPTYSVSSCQSALTMTVLPSSLCCRKTMEERQCFCQYIRDPNLKQFYSNIVVRRNANACGLPFPVCGYQI
ncbi:lipid binding protein, putative [Ricinus communis]|uniref:Lipid binding protein, putative n=1 Tax=Ricinus communis TaxID=3988 RepID=B9SQ13_RICCO|nr:lipid binding protein, putative [Ricinus communis]